MNDGSDTASQESATTRAPISVVVPSRNRAHLLGPCLSCLRTSLRQEDELIVVDSASRNDSVAKVARSHGATLVRCDRPGTSLARNTGWRKARHDLIAFIDDDVRVDEGWADAMAETFRSYPDAAYVTGRIGPPPTPAKYLVAQKTEKEPAWLTGTVGEGHGANLCVRRHGLERVGGFDELLGPGTPLRAAEDIDLFERLIAAGFRGRYAPGASTYHESWRDTRAMFVLQWSYGVGLGARLVKVARIDRDRLLPVARATFIEDGLKPLLQMLRQFALRWTLLRLTRVAGVLAGMARASLRKVESGHFLPRERHAPESRDEPR